MSKTEQLIVSDEAALALSRLGHLNLASNANARDLRSNIGPGQYQGDVTVRLVYDIKVGESHEAEVAASVPWKAIAGALFAKLNAATRDKLVRELLADDFTVKPDAQNAEAEAAISALVGKTRKTVSGKVTGNAVLLENE